MLLEGKPWSSGDGTGEAFDSGIDVTLVPAPREHLARFGLPEQEVAEVLAQIAAEEGHAQVLAAGLRAQGYEEFAAAVEKADQARGNEAEMAGAAGPADAGTAP